MRRHGINYDTGFDPFGDESSRPHFDADAVRRDMAVIVNELHCDAVRVSGADPERLSVAAQAAAEAGLEVWFAPFPCNMAREQLIEYFAECARRAQRIRATGAEVVYVTGCEVSLFNPGFIPGDDLDARLNAMMHSPSQWYTTELPAVIARLNTLLADVADEAHKHFGGPISYASGPWEHIDWTPFDIVGVDAYRAHYNEATFPDEVRGHLRHGKPVVATEFGCCTYRGAAARGGAGWMVLEKGADGERRLKERLERDEREQSRYFSELLAVFEEEGLDAAFWFTYASWHLIHHSSDPARDTDMAAYGVQAVLPDGTLRPKHVFRTIAAAYAKAKGD
ncbi:hypothetical protein [Streptomyces sp. RPT161]|uniref:hypothetical protein n=1 Tax=Streptomyces sp. RPT161 TaxID=3015993 RepID=UPI0022B912DF|nr:hypothetical protein [Streptomyces sp. RPT161]